MGVCFWFGGFLVRVGMVLFLCLLLLGWFFAVVGLLFMSGWGFEGGVEGFGC